MNTSTKILLILLVCFMGFYFYNSGKEEVIKEDESKLVEYANKIKNQIKQENKYFETTLIPNDWLEENKLNDLKCKEVYYDGENILLHECMIENKKRNYYKKEYPKTNDEYNKIYNDIKNMKFEDEKGKLLNELVVENEKIKKDECINSTCKVGTKLLIQVSPKEKLLFNVIKDDGKEVTLLLDHNLENYIFWAQTYNTSGPITLIESISKKTDSWTNISKKRYKFEYKENESITSVLRATLPTKEELKDLKFANENLKDSNGYWLMDADTNKSFNAYAMTKKGIEIVDITTSNYGYRPIIKINR